MAAITGTNIYWYGSETPLTEQVGLRAGPLTLLFEGGDLRYIKLGEREVVRRIYAAVRDRNWGTIAPVLSNLKIDQGVQTFKISFEVENKAADRDIDFAWRGEITGDEQGTIRFTMDGEAHSTFLRNRIGFCVLHPAKECAGAACIVEKADGSQECGQFPVFIAPRQPFLDMRAISHEVFPDTWAEVRFEGDIFEMEDQRAWIDASFKTYCTPLSLGFPVEIKKGTTVRQSVTLSLRGSIPAISAATQSAPVVISRLPGYAPIALPGLGLGSASHGQPLSPQAISRLRELHLSHLRVDLTPDASAGQLDPASKEKLQRAASESNATGIPLEIALLLNENAESQFKALAACLAELRPAIWGWLIFFANAKTTSSDLIASARQHLLPFNPAATFGGGTNVYFAELNRDRPTADTLAQLDVLNYSANPQVHAFDNSSLAETCEALAATIESALQFSQNRDVSLSPITLKPRFNAVATGPETAPPPGTLPPQVDPRQMSLFGAAWTLGSFKFLAESGHVAYATYYETTGWRGVMETEPGASLPEKFPSIAGGVYPLYHVLADLGDLRGGEVYPIQSSERLRVDGLLLHKQGKTRLLLANWTEKPQQVEIGFGSEYMIWSLDAANVEQAMRAPEAFRQRPGTGSSSRLTLAPFAVVRVDMAL